MGAFGYLTGTAGGAGGTGFSGPQGVSLNSPATIGQVNAGNTGVGNSLDQTRGLLYALNQAGGIGNQSQVFNQGQGLATQLGQLGAPQVQGSAMNAQGALNRGLAGLGGTVAMGAAMGGQGALAGQLLDSNGIGAQQAGIGGLLNVLQQQQGIANGTGPNPALAQLNQATGQNVANQAALMAGQRGAGANVGLMARQAAQQGAATQQQAAGQAATLQAQQQMNALNNMGAAAQGIAGIGSGLTGQTQQALSGLFGQGQGATGMLQTGIGQQFGQGATTVGQQQAQQGLNAGIAQNQVANTLGAAGTNLQGNISNAGQLMQGLSGYNANQVNMQGNINASNTSLANTGMQGQQAMIGGMLNGLGSIMGGGGARGGLVKPRRMAEGGDVTDAPYAMPSGQGPVMQAQAPVGAAGTGQVGGVGPVAGAAPAGPQSSLGQFLSGMTPTTDYLQSADNAMQADQAAQVTIPQNTASQDIQAPSQMGYGSQMLYKGASSAGASVGKLAGKAGMAAMAAKGGLANQGGGVEARTPDEKAEKSGNSYANDKVPAMLSEGEIVIPRSVLQGSDPVAGAAEFVRQILAKKKGA